MFAAGMSSAWVKRSPDAVFDPWGIGPTINSLTELGLGISNHSSN
jgi:2-haloacid dehalogenase